MENKFERVFDTLEKTKTNWTVNKLPLVSAPDLMPTGSYGIFRSDNNEWLGTVKHRYAAYQNHALVELLLEATDSLNLNVSKGGVLNGGRKVFYQIALPDEHVGNSGLKRYVTALNSHDGSSCIGLGSTNTVIVCQNTFFKAHREVTRIKHHTNAADRLREMAEQIRASITRDETIVTTFKRMAEVQLKDEMIRRVVDAVFKTDGGKDISQRRKNQVTVFAGNLQTEVNTHGSNIWALFNAVTRYTNHHAAPRSADGKLDYVMNGTGQQLSNLAFNELLEYVDARSWDNELVLV